MLDKNEAIRKESEKVLISRLWAHTIGIVNQKPITGTLNGKPCTDEQPGTSSAIRWGQHHCILTANHVIEHADRQDLRFFFRPNANLDIGTREELERQDYIEHHPGWSAEIYDIIRCEWEDMAIITVKSELKYLNAEFFDLESAWGDPAVGTVVSSAGFPTHEPVHLGTIRRGTNEEHRIGLALTPWDGPVVDKPDSYIESYTETNPFDPERHFFAKWDPPDPKMKMKGFSGGAVWSEAPTVKGGVWSIKLIFAGMCTHQKGKLARMVRASAVRRFLEESLSRADGVKPTTR
jgi:hypothetical protein